MVDMNKINQDDPSYLIISPKVGKPTIFDLESGGSVFVGSGSNCRLVLEGEGVHGIHCMVWMDDAKQLKVQDWNTGKTFLNGQKLDDEADFKSGDILTVADFRLIPVLTREFHIGIACDILELGDGWGDSNAPSAPAEESEADALELEFPSLESLADEDDVEELEAIEQVVAVVARESDDHLNLDADENIQESSVVSDGVLVSAIALPCDESEQDFGDPFVKQTATEDLPRAAGVIQSGGFTYDLDADLNEKKECLVSDFSADSGGFADETFHSDFSFDEETDHEDQNEEASMLRLEVEQLRFELAERDAMIGSMKDHLANSTADESDSDQTLKLVHRLEELLAELRTADDRVQSLEELLRVSDEATQAEQEERKQLENWVSEIEQRVASRESEYKAEIQRLTARLERSQEDLDNTEGQINQLIQSQRESGSSDAETQELIEQGRKQILDLRDQIENLKAENEKLTSGSTSESGAEVEGTAETLKELQDKLVTMQVETSRERAEMARKHAELERIRDTLQDQLENAKTVAAGDSKIRAMRDHLREIHEKEKVEQEEIRKRSLSGRIASLLSRLR